MARLQAQADPARYKQIDYSCSLQKRNTRTKKKGETSILSGSCEEWTHAAWELPAGRSAEWASGLYTIPRKKTDFNNFSIIHLKYFPRSHSFYKNSRQQNICISLDCFSADVFSAMKRLFLSPRCTTSTLS